MPKLRLVKGNLFNSQDPVLAHGVNCKKKFGAGVAAQIAKHYPQAKLAYMERPVWSLGDVQFVKTPSKIIANMATQLTYGRTGLHTNYEAVRLCLTKLFDYCDNNNLSVSLPKIGAGLGGGSWEIIENIMTEVLEDYENMNVTIYYL